ncbi:transcriptional regulator, partial [Vibrio parahaemolyticus]
GRRTLHSFVNGDYEISVVGDIPPATAQRIAQSVTFNVTKSKQ